MPPKNKTKIYGENVFYHAYNRGYNKQTIFRDGHDYKTFLYLIRKYLEPGFQEKRFTPKGEEYFVEPNHIYNEVDLVAYCLMPNHFHLLVFQKSLAGMTKLLSRVSSNYSTYYNKKYQSQGSPFQDTYKAVIIKTEEQLIHLSRYIHLNPIELVKDGPPETWPYSSYSAYLDPEKKPTWLKPEVVLGSFENPESYKDFVVAYSSSSIEKQTDEMIEIKSLILEG